jgi:hypothetical protein
MATVTGTYGIEGRRSDILSGTPRTHAVDRWIFVFMAAWFIAIVLVGFVPSSLTKVAAVQAGSAPPFPLVLHAHAVLTGAFLLLVLAQTWLMAMGRTEHHMRLGLLAMVLAPALVVVGFMLAPTIYNQALDALRNAPPEAQEKLRAIVLRKENILLQQSRGGFLFAVLLLIGLRARSANVGLHKRMMILATAMPLSAAFNRMGWLPTTMPASPTSLDILVLVAIAPMVAWDLIRNRRVHEAYWIWLAFVVPTSIAVHALWDTQWWHQAAHQMMGS